MNTGNNPLENFTGFDSMSETEDLFNSTVDVEEQEQEEEIEEEEQEEDEVDEDDGTLEKGKKKEKQEDLFSGFEEEENEDEDEEEGDDKPSNDIKEFFKKSGYYNEEEDKDLEPDDLLEKAVESRMEEIFSGLPDVAKQFNKFVTKGGNPEEFFKTVASEYSQPELSEDLDISKKENQELVLRTMLAKDGNDQEEIDAQIEYFKDSGKLESISKKKFEKWKEQKNEMAENLSQKKAQEVAEEKRRLREDKRELSSFLQKNDSIGDVPFTPHDKTKLASYMIDKSVKLKNGKQLTQFQKDLYYDLPSNQEAFMQLGVMMRNRNEDGTFNFDAIKEDIESSVSKNMKKNIRNSKGKGIKGSGSKTTGTRKKSLAEMFD